MKRSMLTALVLAGGLSSLLATSAMAANPKGKELYDVNCAACHGEKGDGKGPAGESVQARDFSSKKNFKFGTTEKQLVATLKKGVEGTAMAGYSHLKEDELKALAQYVMTFIKK